jgi:hypothetical protein
MMTDMLRSTLDRLIEGMTAVGNTPYLVLDSVWQEDLAMRVRANDDGWEPLMGAYGEHKHDAHMRSPLVIDLARHADVIDPWLAEGFPAKLGIVVFSDLPIEGVRSSLKRFSTMLTPEFRKPTYFRFYDARVLYCFLNTGFPRQWADFLRDVAVIAAPSDLAAGWTVYMRHDEKLRVGTENPDGNGIEWRDVSRAGADDPNYELGFPFRRLTQTQYESILVCCRRGFHAEIHDFLLKAFPEDAADVSTDEMLGLISRAQDTAERLGYSSENCVFYWAVLTFMAGEGFHTTPNTEKYLEIQYMSPENKLETLIEQTNKTLNNPHLTELIDVYEAEIALRERTTHPLHGTLGACSGREGAGTMTSGKNGTAVDVASGAQLAWRMPPGFTPRTHVAPRPLPPSVLPRTTSRPAPQTSPKPSPSGKPQPPHPTVPPDWDIDDEFEKPREWSDDEPTEFRRRRKRRKRACSDPASFPNWAKEKEGVVTDGKMQSSKQWHKRSAPAKGYTYQFCMFNSRSEFSCSGGGVMVNADARFSNGMGSDTSPLYNPRDDWWNYDPSEYEIEIA